MVVDRFTRLTMNCQGRQQATTRMKEASRGAFGGICSCPRHEDDSASVNGAAIFVIIVILINTNYEINQI